jgi:general nucleoside transport system permease protein
MPDDSTGSVSDPDDSRTTTEAASESAERRFAAERQRSDRIIQFVTPFVSVAIAIAVGSLLILASGQDPVAAFAALWQGAFGSQRAIGETLLRSTPLMFTGLALAYGFRAGLFNIGAEGQLFLGGLAAAFVGIKVAGMPWIVSVPLILLSAAAAGAAWAFIPALMKARIGANEVITTMMFSYIGKYLVSYLVTGPLSDKSGIPQTAQLPATSMLPRLNTFLPFLLPTRAHAGILLAVVMAFVVWVVLKYTTLGYDARAVGFNPFASQAGGISVQSTIIKSLCISGALAGLAGAVEVMGVYGRLFDSFSNGFGFTGIAVALLAKNNPLAVIAAALLFGALSAGAGTMQLEANVSQQLVAVIQAIIIFLVAAETIVTWVVERSRKRKAVAPVAG